MRKSWIFGILGLLAAGAPARAAQRVAVRTSDVTNFYRIYDAARGAPSAATLQRDYIDKGSDGVRQFIPHRIQSADALAKRIMQDKSVYDAARACMRVLPTVKRKLHGAFARLAAIDPQASFPPVTILIGRNSSGGTTGKSGVLIGLEVVCRSNWMQADLSERLYHIITHEYGHVQQDPALEDEATATVLSQSLVEGVAELVGFLMSGEVSNVHLQAWTAGRAEAIDRRFLADADKKDMSAWLYNGAGTPTEPGDLGYWVGFRIAKAYYDRALDKRAALRALLDLKDPRAILEQSGWQPGH